VAGTPAITPERSSLVLFSRPYLEFNQGIAVNRRLSPNAVSIVDLRGLTAGIQTGNTSDAMAKRLLAQGQIGGIRYYPYHGITDALDDLAAGRIGLIIKHAPSATSPRLPGRWNYLPCLDWHRPQRPLSPALNRPIG
jgi:polar amino acid transport system substrate-binding protein